MKNKFLKLTSFLLSFVMLFSTMTTSAMATEDTTQTTTTTSYTDASGNDVKTVKVAELTDELSALDSKTTEEYNVYGSFGELLQNSGDKTQTEQYVQDSTGETVITAYGTENQTVESTVTDGFGQTISESDANTNEGKELDLITLMKNRV